MLSTKWGGFAARAALFVSSRLSGRADQATSVANTLSAAKVLQAWYSEQTGLWETTGWWNSANCLTVLADWALADHAGAVSVGVPGIMSNTYSNAQTSGGLLTTVKTLSDQGMPTSFYNFHRFDNGSSASDHDHGGENKTRRRDLEARGFSGFLNEFYDDEGWWALAWIRSWDVTKQPEYLDMAERIFADMHNGTDNTCGGGIWWSKETRYKNAIANELYLSVSASLANRVVSSKKAYYLQIAQDSWKWFNQSGMINPDNLINDGLTIQPDGSCVNNGLQTWSYNQGVILGGLVELSRASGDKSLLDKAVSIASAAISKLADEKGVIHEIDRCEPNCGDDGAQFKGIFVRNLKYLVRSLGSFDRGQAGRPGKDKYGFGKTIEVNADSIWANDRNGENQLGVSWAGPVEGGRGPTAGSHSSAMDVLVADVSLGSKGGW